MEAKEGCSLDQVIKDIVAADRAARERVEAVQLQKEQIHRELETKRKELEEKYKNQFDEALENQKTLFNQDLKELQGQKQQELNDACSRLEEIYQTNKDAWVKQMFQSCIE